MPSREAPVVLICGDVGAGPVPLRVEELAAEVRRELSGAAPLVLPEICELPEALVVALATSEPAPCRHRLPGSLATTGGAAGTLAASRCAGRWGRDRRLAGRGRLH